MESQLHKVLVPIALTVGITGGLLLVRHITFRVLRAWAAKTTTQLDDIIIGAIRGPSILLVAAIGVRIGISFAAIPERYLVWLTKSLHVVIILSVTVATATLAGELFRHYVRRVNIPLPTTGLAYGILKGSIYIIGFLIILSVLGISIAPLITALGVGGLAVALALQDTLANLFAGIHILLEKSVRVGDFIKLESGQEGYIQDITWRTTRVRMLPNNVVVVPNSKLAQSVVTNYYLPEKRMSLLLPIGVSYAADPDVVERVLVEEATKGTADIPGLLADPAPFVRFIPGFGDSSLDFTLVCQVAEFPDQYGVQHELRKRIFRRFKQEGIDIPYPHRTVYLREEKEWKA